VNELTSYGGQPTEQRVVTSGRIMTGGGASAGIDLALTLAADIAGPEVAQTIQLAIEYDPHSPFDSGAPSKAPKQIYDMAVAALGD
jgi:transcriptional regulator GlxA family with amidase domain